MYAGSLVILLLAVAWTVVNGANVDDINRLNYGVLFKAIKREHIVNRIWRHSFVFDLPQRIVSQRHHNLIGTTERNASSSSKWYADCIHEIDREVNPDYVDPENMRGVSWNRSLDFRGVCDALKGDLREAVRITREKHGFLKRSIEELEALVPYGVPDRWHTQSIGSARNKKSIIPIIGKAASGLFGLATEEQLETVAKHMSEVLKMTHDQTVMFERVTGDLSSFSKTVNDRLENLIHGVNKQALVTHRAIITQQGNLDRDETKILLVNKQLALGWEIEKIRRHIDQFKNALQLLTMGFLPCEVLTPAMLREAIQGIRIGLNGAYTIVSNNPLDYYKHARFVHTRKGDKLLITVDFPLTAFETPFMMYEIVLNDMPVPHNEDTAMRLKTDIKGIAVGNPGHEVLFLELNEFDLWEMKSSVFQHKERRVFQQNWGKSCVISIYRDNAARIKMFCDYQILPGKMVPSVKWLHDDNFLMTAIESYTIRKESNMTVNTGCTQCVLTIPHQGSLETNDFLITGGYGNNDEQDTIKYLINKPIASHFFSDKDLEIIDGNTMFAELPQLHFPNMTLRRPNETLLVAEDNDLKLSMKKAMEAIKNDNVIVHTLADKVYWDGKLDMDAGFGKLMDWVTVGVGISVFLASLQLFYLTARMRQLALTMAVLQQATGIEGELILSYFTSTTTQAEVISNNTIEESAPGLQWLWLCTGLGLGISLAVIVYVIRNKSCKEGESGTYIALNIGGRSEGEIVNLMKCHVTASDIEVRVQDGPTGLEVMGWLKPRLYFYWTAQVVIKSLNVAKTIPQQVDLTFQQARALRRLTQQGCIVRAIFVEGSSVTAVPNVPKGPQEGSMMRGLGPRRGSMARDRAAWSMTSLTDIDRPAPVVPGEMIAMTQIGAEMA